MNYISIISSILLGLLGFAFVIAFHELGHFLFCKLFKIKTPSFSIGFGPKILSKKIGDTLFSLSLIPMGGYVEISGIEEVGQGEQKTAHDRSESSFAIKPYYQKILVLLGGIIFNLFFTYIALVILFAIGMPKTQMLYPDDCKVVIDTIIKESSAEKAGIETGESIIKIDNIDVANSLKKTMQAIKDKSNQKVNLVLEKDNKERTLTVNLNDSLGVTFKGDKKIIYDKPMSITSALKKGLTTTWELTTKTALSLTELAKKRSIDGLGGPIMVLTALFSYAEESLAIFIIFLAFISINLAVLNLIPVPVFDGGQIVKVTIETIIGKPLPEKIIYYIDYGCWILLILFMIIISFADVKKLINF